MVDLRNKIPLKGKNILVEWMVKSTTGADIVKKYKANVRDIRPLPTSKRPSLALGVLVYPANVDYPSPTQHTVYFLPGARVSVILGDDHDDDTPTPWTFEEGDGEDPPFEPESNNEELVASSFNARIQVFQCRSEIAELKESLTALQRQLYELGVHVHTQGSAQSSTDIVLQSLQLHLLNELGKPPRQKVRMLKKKQSEEDKASLTFGTFLRSFVSVNVPCSYRTFQDILKKGRAHPKTHRTPDVLFLPCYPETARPVKSMSYHAVFLTFHQLCAYIGIMNVPTRCEMLFASPKTGGARILGTVAKLTPDFCGAAPDVHLTPGVSSRFVQGSCRGIDDSEKMCAPSLMNEKAEYMIERDGFRDPFRKGERFIPHKMDASVDDKEFPYSFFYLSWAGLPTPNERFDSEIPYSVDPQGTLHVSMPVVETNNDTQKNAISALMDDKKFVDAIASDEDY